MDWLLANQETIWAAIGAFMALITIIVRWTKTPKDDLILDRVLQVVNILKPAPKADPKDGPKAP